jgi:hypothetical protein
MIDIFHVSQELAEKRGLDIYEGFTLFEVPDVLDNYVCAVCHNDLQVYQLPGDSICIVACPEHGSVEVCGRVRNSTVNIDYERASRQYWQVIRNLPDLWGELIPPEVSKERVATIINELGY